MSGSINLRHIELFVAIVDSGGFTAAAERLRTAQPAVSAGLRKLEAEIGAPLMIRGKRRLALTAEGAAFLRHARAILAQLAASRRDVAALRAMESGQVSFGAPPMVAGYLLSPVIADFLATHPGLRLTIVQAGAEEIRDRVVRGDLDLGIVAEQGASAGLATRLVRQHPMVACVAASSPLARKKMLSWSEFFDQRLILFPKSYYQRRRIEEIAVEVGRSPTMAVEMEAVPLMLDLVRRGHGVATLLAAAARARGVRAIALPGNVTVPIAVCRRADAPASTAAEAFYRHLVERLAGP